MAEIINLRRARKIKTRADAEQTAATQRLKFGRTKAQRKSEQDLERRRENALDGHRRVRGDEI